MQRIQIKQVFLQLRPQSVKFSTETVLWNSRGTEKGIVSLRARRFWCIILLAMQKLELRITERDGGGGKTGREFLDFVVDGQSLYELIGQQFDTVSCLARWPKMKETHDALKRLLLRETADFLNNRRSLYICGECGGLDCGAVSVVIEQQQDTFTWHSFGYERDWEDKLDKFEGIGPFVFNKKQYVAALENAVELL